MSGHTTGEKLHVFLERVFSKLGMPEEDAAWTADTLVTAELRGVTSHGVIRMPHYAKRLEVNLANPAPDFRIVKDAGALALADRRQRHGPGGLQTRDGRGHRPSPNPQRGRRPAQGEQPFRRRRDVCGHGRRCGHGGSRDDEHPSRPASCRRQGTQDRQQSRLYRPAERPAHGAGHGALRRGPGLHHRGGARG